MKLKLAITEGITCTLGSFGAVAIIIGGGSCLGGLTATGVIKAGEMLSQQRPVYQRLMFYGSALAGSGLFLVGTGMAIASTIGERLYDEEAERLAKELVPPTQPEPSSETAQETISNWQKIEELKSFCRGCQHYSGGGHCRLHGYSKFDCDDRIAKRECTDCKYYYGSEYLPCAVHPELKRDCSDWEV